MIKEISQDILNIVRLAKCHITYSQRYCGIVISHSSMSEVLYCTSEVQLMDRVKRFIDNIGKLKGVQS